MAKSEHEIYDWTEEQLEKWIKGRFPNVNGSQSARLGYLMWIVTEEMRPVVKEHSGQIQAHHDEILRLKTAVYCPSPGLCLQHAEVVAQHEGAIRKLEKTEAKVVAVCATIAFVVPTIVTVIIKLV